MAKGWSTFHLNNEATIEKTNQKKQCKTFKKMMSTIKIKSFDDLKKHNDEVYAQKKAEEDFLLAGLEDNKLQSKELIKKAFAVKKDREKANKKKEKEPAQ